MTKQKTPMGRVAAYYHRMARENGIHAAMAFTLEMYEGLTEAQIERAIFQHDTEGYPVA